MGLRCPFCNAKEDTRIEAVDYKGKEIVLVMFDCAFSFKFRKEQLGSDKSLQKLLESWRAKKGDMWLQSLGPVIREREKQAMKKWHVISLNNN